MMYDFICKNCSQQKFNQRRFRGSYCNYCYFKLLKNGSITYIQNTSKIIDSFDESQLNLLNGLMLGDGNLFKRKGKHNNAYLQVSRSIKDLDYLKFQANILYDFLTPAKVFEIDVFNKERKCHYKQCKFLTQTHSLFTDTYHKWYPGNIKHVPSELKLNSEIMAYWFCDDGSISVSKSPHVFHIELATNGFVKDEVFHLKCLLTDRYNEKFFISTHKGKNNIQYRIGSANDASRALLNDIDPFINGFMERKSVIWRRDAGRFYSKIPKRMIIEKDIINFILNKKEFSSNELAFNLNLLEDRKLKNGVTQVPIYGVFRPYINKYIEEKYLEKKSLNGREYMFILTELGKQNLKYDPYL